MVPLQIKGSSTDGTIMVPDEGIKALLKKQSEGAPIVLSRVPKDGTVPAQANSDEENLAVLKTQLVDIPDKKFRLIKPKNSLAESPETVDAQPKSLPESSSAVSTVQPQSVNVSQGVYTTVQPGVQSLPIHNHPSPLTSPNSPVISINTVGSLSPFISTRTPNALVTTVGDVRTFSSSNMLPRSQNATTVNNVQLSNVVRLSYTVFPPSVPSNTLRIQKINVLPPNSSVCPTQSTVRTILPKIITLPGTTQRIVERPVSVQTAPILVSSNERLGSSAPSRCQPLVSEINDPMKKNGELKVNVQSPSGGVVTMASQSGTRTIQSLPASAKASSKTVGQRLKIKKITLRHKLTREVVVPRAAQDGGLRLEMRVVPVDKEANTKLQNHQYTVKEVSNNPSESGVAKKFVVIPAFCGPVSSPLMTQPTSSTTTDTSPAINIPLPSVPPWLKNKPGDIRNCTQDRQSAFQWHHPYTGDPPRAAEAPEVVRDSGTENDQVMISDDDDAQPVTEPSLPPCHAPGVPESNYETVCISDDDEKPGIATSSVPPLANSGMHSVMSTQLSSDSTENSPDNDPSSLRIESGSIQSNVHYEVLETLNSETNCSGGKKFQWHQPCTDFEAHSARDNFTLVEDSKSIIQSEAPNVKFQVKAANNVQKRTGTSKTWPRKPVDDQAAKKKKKKTNKKKKKTKKVEKLKMKKIETAYCVAGSKTDVTSSVSTSTRPTLTSGDEDPLIDRASSPSMGSSFQWHHPSTATDSEKSAEDPELVEIKAEPECLHSNSQHAEGPSSPEYGPGPRRTEDTSELQYSPDAEGSSDNGQDFPKLIIDSVHSVAMPKCAAVSSPTLEQNQNHSSYNWKDALPSSSAVSDQREAISANDSPSACLDVRQKKRKNVTLSKMQLNLKRRMKAMAESLYTSCPNVSRPLRRAKVGGQEKNSNKINSKLPSSASSTQSRAEKKRNVPNLKNCHAKQEESSRIDSNVLRDCIVRKTIQDCYLDGEIPTIDKIHSTWCGSGLDVPKTSVERHLTSIGYNWVPCKSRMVLLEDHRVTAERIKYLNKLKKNQGKNLVYIFVSEYVKKSGNAWQLSPTDVVRPSRDSVSVVLHAVSNRCLVEGGLEIIKLGLFGLRRSDVISWLKCKVLPNIPYGSVVIFGNHPLFDKDKETEERPNIGHSKEDIVSWLVSHKVTSVNPKSPKAFLLCKVNNVILPKTSIFDQLILQNDSVPLHLPKHHSDLNPIEFIWRDIIDELFKMPEISNVDSFQDFVTRRFSTCSSMPLVACNLVRNFECAYREFDLRSDELFDKLLSGTGLGTNDAADSAPVAAAKKNLAESECPVCLHVRRFKGFRCSSCKGFWSKLKKDHQYRRKTGVTLPVCNKPSHIAARPPDCSGCRRHRYEHILLNIVNIMKKRPNYVLPIPPVTEMGKKLWSKKKKPKSKKS